MSDFSRYYAGSLILLLHGFFALWGLCRIYDINTYRSQLRLHILFSLLGFHEFFLHILWLSPLTVPCNSGSFFLVIFNFRHASVRMLCKISFEFFGVKCFFFLPSAYFPIDGLWLSLLWKLYSFPSAYALLFDILLLSFCNPLSMPFIYYITFIVFELGLV